MQGADDLRFTLASIVGCSPVIFFLTQQLRGRRVGNLVSPETGITIEGFPRSGTTFAVRAFNSVNREIRIAHHHHAAAQVLESVRLGLPTLLIVRSPEGAVRSLMIRRPELSAAAALSAYRRFHDRLAACRKRIVIASFDQVTKDFGQVIDRVNDRYGTRFRRFDHTTANVDAIFRAMERDNASAYGRLLSTHVPRPDPERDRAKDRIQLDGQPALARARHAYQSLVDDA